MADRPRLLAVDDDATTLKLVGRVLGAEGYDVVAVDSGPAALDRVSGERFHAALVDVRMPGMGGLELLAELKRREPALDVVIMTAHPDLSTAIRALRSGAYDYLQKPFDLDELRHCVARVVERRFLRREVDQLRTRLGEALPYRELVGVSPAIAAIRSTIARVAPTDSAVLIEGESGTGKELVAAAVHRQSPRAGRAFVPVNCGALPADLLESELFGHVRGAFTGAARDAIGLFRAADGGTIFLDEVGELPLALQVKLLRVLQEKEIRPVGATRSHRVDVRIVAATNRDLEAAVEQGAFRRDLFYRLNVVRLVMPPLRQRKDDVAPLVRHFVGVLNDRFGRDVSDVAPDAMAVLAAHDWPGNVRELENALERAYALGAAHRITLADLPVLASSGRVVVAPDAPLPTLAEVERELILAALRRHPGNKDAAARALGLSPRTLYRRLRDYRLE